MKRNSSPWLHQLQSDRVHTRLNKDIHTDIAVIGAGIAGVSTAFFLLKHTDKKVSIFEHYKLAHGATGHNAGQVVSYFERGFASLVEEFGLEQAADAQKAIEDAWELLNEMYTDASLDIPFSRFLGHAGLGSFDHVMLHLNNNYSRHQAGLNTERILVSEDAPFIHEIPEKYHSLYSVVPHREVITTLETTNQQFFAVLSYQKGCINSALLCEKIVLHLIATYPGRIELFEHTTVKKIILNENNAVLDADMHSVAADKVVLCTNGFENLTIINNHGLDVNTRFHHLIKGTVGYMSGYLEKMNKPPIAISYLPDSSDTNDAYFYLTRRLYEYEPGTQHNLISIGGPEADLEDIQTYSWENEFPEEMTEHIDAFVRANYAADPHAAINYVFTWHGLMGYTQNGVRLIGPEPKNPILLYNLGCNGVGILPSVYGGLKITKFITNSVEKPSIFDVPSTYKP